MAKTTAKAAMAMAVLAGATVRPVAAAEPFDTTVVVHVRDYQHIAGTGVGRHAGHEAVRIEFRCERAAFLDLLGRTARGKGDGRAGQLRLVFRLLTAAARYDGASPQRPSRTIVMKRTWSSGLSRKLPVN